MIKYKRNTPELSLNGSLWDSRKKAHDFTGGIIHMLDDKYVSLDEIVGAAEDYNAQWGETAFETDKLKIAEYMSVLVSVGMAWVEFKEDDNG